MDWRARLERFYSVHSPAKVPEVDATLVKFKGREEALFAGLVSKYGPEPSSGVGQSEPHESKSWVERGKGAFSAAQRQVTAFKVSNSYLYMFLAYHTVESCIAVYLMVIAIGFKNDSLNLNGEQRFSMVHPPSGPSRWTRLSCNSVLSRAMDLPSTTIAYYKGDADNLLVCTDQSFTAVTSTIRDAAGGGSNFMIFDPFDSGVEVMSDIGSSAGVIYCNMTSYEECCTNDACRQPYSTPPVPLGVYWAYQVTRTNPYSFDGQCCAALTPRGLDPCPYTFVFQYSWIPAIVDQETVSFTLAFMVGTMKLAVPIGLLVRVCLGKSPVEHPLIGRLILKSTGGVILLLLLPLPQVKKLASNTVPPGRFCFWAVLQIGDVIHMVLSWIVAAPCRVEFVPMMWIFAVMGTIDVAKDVWQAIRHMCGNTTTDESSTLYDDQLLN